MKRVYLQRKGKISFRYLPRRNRQRLYTKNSRVASKKGLILATQNLTNLQQCLVLQRQFSSNFFMYQTHSHRDHSATRPGQQHILFSSKITEPQQLTNIPYSGLTTFQVVVNNPNPMAGRNIARPPSNIQTCRPFLAHVSSPRSQAGQSRERSIDRSNISNTSHDDSIRGATNSNYLKTITKPNLHNVLPYVPRDLKAHNKQNNDPQSSTNQDYSELKHQKQLAQTECQRLRQQFAKVLEANKLLKASLTNLQHQHQQTVTQLSKSKHLLANYSCDMSKLTHNYQELQQQNLNLRQELIQAKKLLPKFMARFDKLERMNAQLQETIRKDNQEWQKSKMM